MLYMSTANTTPANSSNSNNSAKLLQLSDTASATATDNNGYGYSDAAEAAAVEQPARLALVAIDRALVLQPNNSKVCGGWGLEGVGGLGLWFWSLLEFVCVCVCVCVCVWLQSKRPTIDKGAIHNHNPKP
jgi:hypothetical protein